MSKSDISNDSSTVESELGAFAADTIKSVRMNKAIIPLSLLVVLIAAFSAFCIFILPLKATIAQIGSDVGNVGGSVAGIAAGSVEGATIGLAEGAQKGKEEGLKAEDTVVEIANSVCSSVKELGNLNVLAANVSFTDYHEVGSSYGVLYLARGNAVFSIDLSQAVVNYNEKNEAISIILPAPSVKVTLLQSEREVLAEWQNKYFDGSSKDGLDAFFNSEDEINENAEQKIAGYQSLYDQAKRSAEKQVRELAEAVRGNGKVTISVNVQD